MKSMENFKQDMPYEKFLQFGPDGLTDRELLAIILRTGTKEKSAMMLAEEVLGMTKPPKEGLLGLYDLSLEELMQIDGIGEVKAVKLKCLTELSMRINMSRAKEGLCFHDAESVANYYMEKLRHRDTECVMIVNLDSKGNYINEKEISNGSVRMSLISPREIFLTALQAKAVNFLLIHNHPSGDPTPSDTDCEMTTSIRELGIQMNIYLLDHIIIGDNRYYSFCEAGI